MTLSDPIADLLTRIRNGCRARRRFVDVDRSNMKLAIVKSLKEEGFIEGYLEKREQGSGVIRIYLRYNSERSSVIKDLKRVSRPGRRHYVGYQEIPKVLGGMGIALLSTPQGVLRGAEARKRKVGGELLCYVW
jgi:small subunit ribosomal protein S8